MERRERGKKKKKNTKGKRKEKQNLIPKWHHSNSIHLTAKIVTAIDGMTSLITFANIRD